MRFWHSRRAKLGRSDSSGPINRDAGEPPRLTVVLVVAGDATQNSRDLLEDWRHEEAGHDVELLVVLAGATDAHRRGIAPHLDVAGVPDSAMLTCPTATLPSAVHAALPHVRAPWVVIWPGYARPESGWVGALRSAIEDSRSSEGVLQPLVIQRDGTIASAGAIIVPNAVPIPHLRGQPVEDARRLGDLRACAPLGPVVVVRTPLLREMEGFGQRYAGGLAEVDLQARAHAGGHGPARVVVGATVLGRGQAAYGFTGSRQEAQVNLLQDHSAWLASTQGEPKPARPAPIRPGSPERPALRWAIDTAAPGGARGRRWGDWMFAQSLARALERQGQHAAVDTKASRGRASREQDDVVVVLRGLDRCQPVDGALNVLWIISHPDEVTREECLGFDLVYAASRPWAERRSEEWGLTIVPLLQCTDPAVFNPGAGRPGSGPAVVFVGNTRGGRRALVEQAAAHGMRPAIVGRGWDGLVDAGLVRGDFVTEAEVADLYASSEVVLCDHWPDMRREGFVSNRVYDALACGAGLICDQVDDLEAIAGGGVLTTGPDDGWGILRGGPSGDAFGTRTERLERARAIADEHSFDARASALIRDVVSTGRVRYRGSPGTSTRGD